MSIFKQHLSGVGVVYEVFKKGNKQVPLFCDPEKPKEKEEEKEKKVDDRPQGSLYSFQRRQISDACEYIRRSVVGKRDRCALIFLLNSPGYMTTANETNFLSQFLDNAKKNYGLGHCVWVRETSDNGMIHFHCVADWWKPSYFFQDYKGKGYNMAGKLSLYWSGKFGVVSLNTFRLGGHWYGRRVFELKHQAQALYLSKYISKEFKQKNLGKSKVKKFYISPELAKLSGPQIYESVYVRESVESEQSKFYSKIAPFMFHLTNDVLIRRWYSRDSDGNLSNVELKESELQKYSWKWTGHMGCYVGFLRRPRKT